MYSFPQCPVGCPSTVLQFNSSSGFLRRQGLQVSYDLVDRDRYEVDFIINDLNSKPHLAIQVCLDLSDPNTIERETRSLSLLKKKYPKIETLIITCYEPSIISDRGFPVIEAWKWLLDCNILGL